MRPRTLLAGALLLLLVAPASAYPSPSSAWTFSSDCSGSRHFVYDFVGLLDDTQGSYVESRGCDLYREDGAHLVLAIVEDLGGESIDSYALHLVREWGIGDRERLDGLLVLYAVDDGTGSGAVRVEVGYGLESVVNSLAAREAVESMEALKASDLANGSTERDATTHALAAGASGLALFTQQNYNGTAQDVGPAGGGGDGFGIPWWGWVLIVALVVLMSLSGAGRRGRGSAGSGFLTGLLLGGLLRRGGGRGGGGWGGRGRGGGGFGGGKSGGGGWGGKL